MKGKPVRILIEIALNLQVNLGIFHLNHIKSSNLLNTGNLLIYVGLKFISTILCRFKCTHLAPPLLIKFIVMYFVLLVVIINRIVFLMLFLEFSLQYI